MWDFHRYWIYGLLILLLGSCVSCAGLGKGKTDSALVDDMAENCKFSMKRGSVKEEDNEKETVVDCFPPGYSL